MLFCQWAILVVFIVFVIFTLVMFGALIEQNNCPEGMLAVWAVTLVLFFLCKGAGTFSLIF